MRVFSDLNLDGTSPVRSQPELGEWGPRNVPSTRWKRWQRLLVSVVFVIAVVAVVALGYFFYRALQGG